MTRRLDGKVALISEAAQGMGECEARLFAHEGARVVLEEQGRKFVQEIHSKEARQPLFTLVELVTDGVAISNYGAWVREQLASWFEENKGTFSSQTVSTYYDPRSLLVLL